MIKIGVVIEVEPDPSMCIWFNRGACTFYGDSECAGVASCIAYEKDNRIEY